MSADWPEFQLGSRCRVKSSKRIFAHEYVENGIPFMRSKDVIDKALGSFVDYEFYISEERFKGIKKTHGSPRKGDLLMSSVGNRSGQPYVIKDEGDFHFKDGNILWLSEFQDINSDYLAYWLKSEIGQGALISIMIGSAQKALTIDSVRKLWVRLPSIEYQNKAVEVLMKLDEKTELNRQTNQTLEQMAQAIFKSWFVDFDPVKAKIAALEAGGSEDDALLAAMQAIAGSALFATDAADADAQTQLARLQAEHPEQYTTLRATAELFPSKMQESELGEIPEGWEATDFGAVSVCFDKHRIPLSKAQRDKRKGHIPYYGATSVMDYVDEHIFDDIFLLLGEDGSVLQKDDTPFIQYIWGKAWVNNHAHVLQGKGNVSTEQILLFMKNQNIAPYVTGAVQLKLNQKNMNSIPFVKATDEVCIAFNLLLKPMFADLRNREDESRILSSLRDTLLPKLLSGELSLAAAEEQLADTVEPAHV